MERQAEVRDLAFQSVAAADAVRGGVHHAHAPLGTAEPRRVPLPDRTVELEYLLARDITPEELLFRRRVVVVFADTPADPAFTAQMVALETQAGPLVDRDVVVVADSDPAAEEAETNDELVALFDANPEEESNVG